MTEDVMVGQHHQFNGHKFEQTQGDSEGQRSLACYSPWGCKKSDKTKQLNNNIHLVILQLTYETLERNRTSKTYINMYKVGFVIGIDSHDFKG